MEGCWKTIGQLAESVKSILDELQALKHGTTHNGLTPISQSGSQDSSIGMSPVKTPLK